MGQIVWRKWVVSPLLLIWIIGHIVLFIVKAGYVLSLRFIGAEYAMNSFFTIGLPLLLYSVYTRYRITLSDIVRLRITDVAITQQQMKFSFLVALSFATYWLVVITTFSALTPYPFIAPDLVIITIFLLAGLVWGALWCLYELCRQFNSSPVAFFTFIISLFFCSSTWRLLFEHQIHTSKNLTYKLLVFSFLATMYVGMALFYMILRWRRRSNAISS